MSLRRRTAVQPALLLTLFLVTTTPAVAQTDESGVRDLIESIAGLVYNTAWPTATYSGFRIVQSRRVNGGFDVMLRLFGVSAFSGTDLWMDLRFELRNGALADFEVQRHNAILAHPFQTAKAVGDMLVQAAKASGAPVAWDQAAQTPPTTTDLARMSALAGAWIFADATWSFYRDGSYLVDHIEGNDTSGSWFVRDETLYTRRSDGRVATYTLDEVGAQVLRFHDGEGGSWSVRRGV